MFQFLKNNTIAFALNKIKEKVLNPKLEGIGVVEELSFRDGELLVRMRLEGLEDHPIEVRCADIKIADDGSSASVGKFTANKKFAQNALDCFVTGKEFEIPEGSPRVAVKTAKKILGL